MSKFLSSKSGIFVQFEDWKDKLSVDDITILGISMEASKLKGLIKTAIIIGTSGLAVGLIGVIAYGGYLWITAGDKEEQLQKAKKVMMNGFMGIVISFGFLLILGILAGFLGVNITNFSFLDDILG